MNLHKAIYKLNPSVVTILSNVAYDADGNEVAYDKAAVEAKAVEMQIESEAAKQSMLNKLMALGLTEEEALSLGK